MVKTAIVILNWNGRKHLEEFLPSVVSHSQNCDIIVVDNHSSDDSVEFLEQKYPEIELIHNTSNGGFAKGYNDGLKQIKTKYEYFVLLNSDVEVTENWTEPIISMLDSDKTISACQPKVLAYKSKENFEHAGASGGFMDINGYPFCRGRIFSYVEKDENQYDTPKEIFWATGACMFVRSEAFFNLGGFDEDYFAHMEEIDLCWRIKLKGLKIMVHPQSIVYHLGGGTLNYMSPRKVFLNFRNSLYTLYKNYTGNLLFLKIMWRMTLDYIAFLKFLAQGDFKASVQVFKAQFDFIKNLPKMRKKRRNLHLDSSNFNAIGVYKKSIVFSAYIQKKTKFSDLDKNDFY